MFLMEIQEKFESGERASESGGLSSKRHFVIILLKAEL